VVFNDDEGEKQPFNIYGQDILVEPSVLGLPNDDNCYITIYKDNTHPNKKGMFIGNFFLNKYYLIFDQTPFEERGENYIYVGMGLRNY